MRSDRYVPVCQGRECITVYGENAHTTQKLEALVHRIIVATSSPGNMLLGPFCGTATTSTVA